MNGEGLNHKMPSGNYVVKTHGILGDYKLWVPAPLPRPLRVPPDTVHRFRGIDKEWRRVSGSPSRHASILLRAEVVGSSLIEDIVPLRSDWDMTWAAHLAGLRVPPSGVGYIDSVHVLNLQKAYRTVRMPTVDSGLADHRMLLAASPVKNPGEYRSEQVWIGGWTPLTASYVPPPARFVNDLVEDLYLWIGEELDKGDLPASLIAAVAHAQFESIHPFRDGNGRAGRILIHRIMAADGGSGVVVPCALVTWADRQGYYSALNYWRDDDGRARWLRWYATVADSAVNYSRPLCAKIDRIVSRLASTVEEIANRLPTARKIIEEIPAQSMFTAQSMGKAIGISPQTVHRAARAMTSLRIKDTVNSSGDPVNISALNLMDRPRSRSVYVCRPLWDLCSPDQYHGSTRIPPIRW